MVGMCNKRVAVEFVFELSYTSSTDQRHLDWTALRSGDTMQHEGMNRVAHEGIVVSVDLDPGAVL